MTDATLSGSEAVGVSFAWSPTLQTNLTSAQAIDIAKERGGDAVASSNVTIQARLGIFSDAHYFTRSNEDSLGFDGAPKSYGAQNRPVWLVTFSGAYSPPRSEGDAADAYTEIHVAVDALTGESIELFAWK